MASLGRRLLGKTRSKEEKNPTYYEEEIGNRLDLESQEALAKYIGLPTSELVPHLIEEREKLWAKAPYPCVGMWSFLRPGLPRHPKFDIIKDTARTAPHRSYLICDVGTGVGQELRSLVMEGVDSVNLRAVDISDTMWNAGFDIYRDRDRMSEARFAKGNVLESGKEPWSSCKETMDVVIAGLLLHLFDLKGQAVAMKNLMSVVKDKSGSMIVGWQIGGTGDYGKTGRSGQKMFSHTEETFRKMLISIDEGIEKKWNIETSLRQFPKEFSDKQSSWLPPNAAMLTFSLVRK